MNRPHPTGQCDGKASPTSTYPTSLKQIKARMVGGICSRITVPYKALVYSHGGIKRSQKIPNARGWMRMGAQGTGWTQLQGDREMLLVGDPMGCSRDSPQGSGWGGAVPRGTGLCPHCQAPAPKGGGILQGIADGQPLQPGDPLGALQAAEENVA